MNGDTEETIQRSQLYNLLVQIDRKVAVVESKVANIELRMEERITSIERQIEQRNHWTMQVQTGVLAILGIAGVMILVLLLTGRI